MVKFVDSHNREYSTHLHWVYRTAVVLSTRLGIAEPLLVLGCALYVWHGKEKSSHAACLRGCSMQSAAWPLCGSVCLLSCERSERPLLYNRVHRSGYHIALSLSEVGCISQISCRARLPFAFVCAKAQCL